MRTTSDLLDVIFCCFSDARGSFTLAASPAGDSVESNVRLGAPPASDPNSADNLLLFDGKNDFVEGEKNSINYGWSTISPSEQYQLNGSQSAKESGQSAAFGFPKNAYSRRNRSQPSCDGARSSSVDGVRSLSGHASFTSRQTPKNAKSLEGGDNQKDHTVTSKSLKATSLDCSIPPKVEMPYSRAGLELDVVQTVESAIDLTKVVFSDAKQYNQFLQIDTWRTPAHKAPEKAECVGDREQTALAGSEVAPSLGTAKAEDLFISSKMNGLSDEKVDGKNTLIEGQNSMTVLCTKGLDSESSCTQTDVSLDGNIDGEICTNLRNGGFDENAKEESIAFGETPDVEYYKSDKETSETKVDNIYAVANHNANSSYKTLLENDSILKDQDLLREQISGSQKELKDPIFIEKMVPDDITASENNRNPCNLLDSISAHESENACFDKLPGPIDSSIQEIIAPTFSDGFSPERKTCSGVTLTYALKAHEDSILEEARIIEVYYFVP